MNNIDRLFGHAGEVTTGPARSTPETAKSNESASAPARRRGDQVSLSPQAKELADAMKAVEDAPDVRAERVAAIQKQLEEGTYNVSDRDLAQALLGALGEQGRG